jgi:diguanylate cyclase (GGDEF)-like protein/PAS domain S-box-containing protein
MVAAVYFIGARVGLALAFDNRNVTAVWPPTGIAVAALVVWGLSMWPGIAIGALLANLSNHAGLATSAAIVVGNTAAPVVAAYVLRRVEWFDGSLERMRGLLALMGAGGFGAMMISATLGTAALVATGAASASHVGSVWLVWWIGDAIGVVLFAPPLILVSRFTRDTPLLAKWRESLILVAFAVAIALTVFNVHIALAYVILVPVVWGAYSFEQGGAALMMVVLAIVAVAETASGHGPFASGTPTQNLISLQIFNAILAFAGFSLASVVRSRRSAEDTLRASEERYRRLFEQATDPILVHDLDGKITYANAATSEATGFSVDALEHMTMQDLVGSEQAPVVRRAMQHLVEVADATSYEIELRGPKGNFLAFDVAAVLVRKGRKATGVQLIARDVTARKINEGNLRRNALRDPGTGLPNRTLLAERIEYALAISEQTGSAVALYMVDIDNFHVINEREGRGAGDALLRTIGHRLDSIVRPTDTVARIGGDSFAILVAPIADVQEGHAFALRVASEVNGISPLAPTTSIGIAMKTAGTRNAETLFREADLALRYAKRHGTGSIEVYSEALEPDADPFDEIRTRLERSIES